MKRKIKILFILDKLEFHGASLNGPAIYYSSLLECIDTERFEITLCLLRGRGQSDALFRKTGCERVYLGLHRFNPFTMLTLFRIIKTKHIDLVHLSGYASTVFGRLAAFLARRPAIVHEHWVDPGFSWPMALVEWLLSGMTTKAIAVSDYSRTFLIDKKRIPADKIIVIPNGIPLQRFYDADKSDGERMRRNFSFVPEDKFVGIIGMLHENKGHRIFIDAAALLKDEFPQLKYLIVGTGELRTELEQQIKEHRLVKSVLFLGQQEDMPSIFQMLDIFVMSSYSESAGLALLEAMAAGKPIITTDCGGPSEVITDGRSGFVVPVRNAEAIAEKIRYLMTHPDASAMLAAQARADSQQYDIKKTARQIEALYLKLFK